MKRFVLQQNIARFKTLLESERNERLRSTLLGLLSTAQREYAYHGAIEAGVGTTPSEFRLVGGPSDTDRVFTKRFEEELEASRDCCLLLHPGPGLNIVEANGAYARATMIDRKHVIGERLFDVFPDNPNDPLANGVSNLFTSLRIASETRRPHAMAVQRYDVRDFAGNFVERYWRPVNSPVFSPSGRLVFLLHRVGDVTLAMLTRSYHPAAATAKDAVAA